jgi:hypothetical protein
LSISRSCIPADAASGAVAAPARAKRAPSTFKQSDVRRAVKAVKDAGVPVQRVELTNGKIVVVAVEPPGPDGGGPQAPADWEDAK